MSIPIVSIITPVYNTDSHLIELCEESVIRQGESLIEWVIVDDGSDGPTHSLLDAVQKRHQCVKLFHIENQGPAGARNVGIANCSGEYVTFLDCDDTLAPNFVESFISIREKYHPHIVFSRRRKQYKSTSAVNQFRNPVGTHLLSEDELEDFRHYILSGRELNGSKYDFAGIESPYSTSRVYVRNLADRIRFDDRLTRGEDTLFNNIAVSLATRVVITDEVWYNYYINDKSLMNHVDIARRLSELSMYAIFFELCHQYNWSKNDLASRFAIALLTTIYSLSHHLPYRKLRSFISDALKLEPSDNLVCLDHKKYRMTALSRLGIIVLLTNNASIIALAAKVRTAFGKGKLERPDNRRTSRTESSIQEVDSI